MAIEIPDRVLAQLENFPDLEQLRTRSVEALLFDGGCYYDFFQAVRMLTLLAPDRKPVGRDQQPIEEVVRFRTHVSLVFPASQIHELTRPDDPSRPPVMSIAFMGLTGLSGALPRLYTELIIERARRKDFVLRDFLDLFHHRLISLFYRAGQKYRFWLNYEYAEFVGNLRKHLGEEGVRNFTFEERPQLDVFSQALLDLQGIGPPSLRYRGALAGQFEPRSDIADDALRYYVGLLAQRRRSAIGLEAILNDYFGVPVTVSQFVGQWLKLPEEDQTCLLPEGGNTVLGENALVGDRVWDVQSKFRVRVGPLRYQQFCDFLPSGRAYRPLIQFVRLYARFQFDFDVQLVLFGEEVPPCELADGDATPLRLGWESWSITDAFSHDVDDPIFTIQDD